MNPGNKVQAIASLRAAAKMLERASAHSDVDVEEVLEHVTVAVLLIDADGYRTKTPGESCLFVTADAFEKAQGLAVAD